MSIFGTRFQEIADDAVEGLAREESKEAEHIHENGHSEEKPKERKSFFERALEIVFLQEKEDKHKEKHEEPPKEKHLPPPE